MLFVRKMCRNSPLIRRLNYIAPFYTTCAFINNAFMLLEESYLSLVLFPATVRDNALHFSLDSGVILLHKCVLEICCNAFNLNFCGPCICAFGWDRRCTFRVLLPHKKVKSLLFLFISITVILYFIGLYQKISYLSCLKIMWM